MARVVKTDPEKSDDWLDINMKYRDLYWARTNSIQCSWKSCVALEMETEDEKCESARVRFCTRLRGRAFKGFLSGRRFLNNFNHWK